MDNSSQHRNKRDCKVALFANLLMALFVILLFCIAVLSFSNFTKYDKCVTAFEEYCEAYTNYYNHRHVANTDLKNRVQNLEGYEKAEYEAKKFKPQIQSVHVVRITSAFDVMAHQAFYNKLSGEAITAAIEKEKGAGIDDITVLFLSDGKIIKASTKDNGLWLGASVGTKVWKLIYKRVVYREKSMLNLNQSHYAAEITESYIPQL